MAKKVQFNTSFNFGGNRKPKGGKKAKGRRRRGGKGGAFGS